MRSLYRCFTNVFLTLLAFSAWADDKINVMTLNQYLGADLAPIISTTNPVAFNQGLVAVLKQAAKSDFRSRARATAIVKRSPDVLALQEVWELRCQDFNPNDNDGCELSADSRCFHQIIWI
ncbi:hypothetical protein [Methylomicrobium sp. Wu6]|uniref:hypothetical protein n=1 Tax=Methylomicrobium sp. Wu6 TaxID=3107928 RepID=UPI002DD651DC|nr:hypothetical protein [Methylomicrobium sp. Wu6]MEC4748894.1 hypothetical protein [Methylomicrobium sp. Wu6]